MRRALLALALIVAACDGPRPPRTHPPAACGACAAGLGQARAVAVVTLDTAGIRGRAVLAGAARPAARVAGPPASASPAGH
jgi:hypothetical protein